MLDWKPKYIHVRARAGLGGQLSFLSGTPVAVLTALGRGRVVSLTANAMFWPELVSPASMR